MKMLHCESGVFDRSTSCESFEQDDDESRSCQPCVKFLDGKGLFKKPSLRSLSNNETKRNENETGLR